MRIIDYHPRNFEEVRKLLKHTQNAFKSGENGRILFNMEKCRFEHYEDIEDIKNVNPHCHYLNIEEAMENYDSPKEQTFVELPNDDTEVLENARNILDTIGNIKKKVDRENQEKLLAVIADIFKLDTVSESDFVKMAVENGELKKIISLCLSLFGVEVSTTKITSDLKVSAANLKFNPKLEYTLEDYRRGLAQASASVEALRASASLIDEKDLKIKELERQLAFEKKSLVDLNGQVAVLREQKDPARELHPVIPISYVISYKTDSGKVMLVSVEKDAEQTKEGSYPTKYLKGTKYLNKAKKFTSSDAKAQITKMVKFKQNVAFVNIKELEGKALQSFFSINRVVVEPAGELVRFETPVL